MEFELRLRIPGWARGEAIDGDLYKFKPEESYCNVLINGKKTAYIHGNGYIKIDRKWKADDVITLEIPMKPLIIYADRKVKADAGLIAIQYGPLVYAAEWVDNPDVEIVDLQAVKAVHPSYSVKRSILKNEIIKIGLHGYDLHPPGTRVLDLIPYHLWNNRGPGPMRVWLPDKQF
jgi:hypothetical protein